MNLTDLKEALKPNEFKTDRQEELIHQAASMLPAAIDLIAEMKGALDTLVSSVGSKPIMSVDEAEVIALRALAKHAAWVEDVGGEQ